ncbi:MAG: hypothetical protein M9930_19055 [Anaerolineae bacterium]|nr:hypothetical protein [Anaerolineae bacterium]
MTNVTSGTVRLKGEVLHSKLNVNMHKLSMTENVTYSTIHKYLTQPDKLGSYSGDVLYAILVTGLGLTPEQAAQLPLGVVFDFVERENGAE